MATDVLQVENLKKTYTRGSFRPQVVRAIKGISFQIPAGQITGFLGANGAGKTTSIKCILGLAFPDSGAVRYFGEREKGLTQDAKNRIGFLPERPYFYDYLTGREFLKFYGSLSLNTSTSPRISKNELHDRITSLLKRVGLTHAQDRPLRSYSKGMLQRIGIAQALIHRPELVILDEPMTGLDPDGRMEVRQIIHETAKEGTAVFFSSHLLPDAESLCENLVILKQGELVFHGKTAQLLGQVERGYVIRTTVDELFEVASLDLLQVKLDELRRLKQQILEVKPIRLSLEEAFMKIAFDGSSGIQGEAR